MNCIAKHVWWSWTFFNRYIYWKIFSGSMSSFTSRVNLVCGKKEWFRAPEHYDFYQEIARSSYADMLHDTERNQKYFAAIKKAIHTMKEQGKAAKVLDIGTGTGLLSMMAARCGADSITACEVFGPVGKCAEAVIKENGFADKIKVLLKHSSQLTVGPDGDLKEKANILVAEVFDTELIGEGAILTFHHALKNLIEADSIVIPSAASVYIQVIDSPFISKWMKLSPVHINSNKMITPPSFVTECPGSSVAHDLQMSQLPLDKFKTLTDPFCIFEFDFTGKSEIKEKRVAVKQIPVRDNGNCDVLFMWWELKMDMDGETLLSTAPKWMQPDPTKSQWRDHWMQAIYYLPDTTKVLKGDIITINAYHDAHSFWFGTPRLGVENIDKNDKSDDDEENTIEEKPGCSCLMHVTDSHLRIGMKNDAARNHIFAVALEKVITPSSVCLCIGDGSLLPLMAAKLGAKKVFAVEPSYLHETMTRAYMEANDVKDKITIIKKEPLNLSKEDLEMEEVNVLISEPYFVNSIRPWDLTCFLCSRLSLRDVLPSDVKVIPQIGRLRAVAVDFEDLWKIRAPVNTVEGFNITKFDQMIQKAISLADAVIEPHPLWEYPCKPLSDAFNLLKFDYATGNCQNKVEVCGEQPITSSGTCNGVALWADFYVDDTILTTGPVEVLKPDCPISWYMNSQQGVYFIDPLSVTTGHHVLKYNISINFKTFESTFTFAIEGRDVV